MGAWQEVKSEPEAVEAGRKPVPPLVRRHVACFYFQVSGVTGTSCLSLTGARWGAVRGPPQWVACAHLLFVLICRNRNQPPEWFLGSSPRLSSLPGPRGPGRKGLSGAEASDPGEKPDHRQADAGV